jgi:hypothetical protein
MNTKSIYIPPVFQGSAYHCPLCNVYANQIWRPLYYAEGAFHAAKLTYIANCQYCHRFQIWHEEKMIYPDFKGIEPPNQDVNLDIQEDYSEAASILQKSPRGAAALLRLAIQKLCVQLGEKGQDLNTAIGNLVKHKNLPQKVQQSLDTLRVIGNESVHPGQLDLKDDTETATALFKLVNFIAEKMLTEPKDIEEIYSKLPESKKEQIKKGMVNNAKSDNKKLARI